MQDFCSPNRLQIERDARHALFSAYAYSVDGLITYVTHSSSPSLRAVGVATPGADQSLRSSELPSHSQNHALALDTERAPRLNEFDWALTISWRITLQIQKQKIRGQSIYELARTKINYRCLRVYISAVESDSRRDGSSFKPRSSTIMFCGRGPRLNELIGVDQ